MAAVDHHRVLDTAGPAHVDDRVEGGPRCAAGVEDVVDQDDLGAVDVEIHLRALDDGLQRDLGEVVAVERDVELPYRGPRALELLDQRGKAFREGYSARVDSHQRNVPGALVPLDELMGDAPHGAVELGR